MKVDGLKEVRSDERMTIYLLANGAQLPVLQPPGWNEGLWQSGRVKGDANEVAKLVRDGLSALAVVDTARRQAAADPTLSDIGRVKRAEPLVQPALATVQGASEQLSRITEFADAEEFRVYAPPALQKDDLVGGLIDQELRNYVRSRSSAQKGALMAEMASDLRLLQAVLRAPFSLGQVSEFAGRLWREHVAENHNEAPAVAHLKEMISWAGTLLPHLPRHITAAG